jgi:hypothetical protein
MFCDREEIPGEVDQCPAGHAFIGTMSEVSEPFLGQWTITMTSD